MTAEDGLAYLRGLIGGDPASPMSRTMGMRLVAVDDGSATMRADPTAAFHNPQARLHGGYAAALIDSAMGCAVQTRLAADTGYGTIEMKVNYVGKLDAASAPLTCVATVLHAGSTLLTAEAKVYDAQGKLRAHGSGTFLVFPKRGV